MINIEQLYNLLLTLNLPISYSDFKNTKNEKPLLPFVSYYETNSDNLSCDNSVYQEQNTVIIELYTQVRDLNLERKIKKLLNDNKIFYETSHTDISDDDVHICYFTISIF